MRPVAFRLEGAHRDGMLLVMRRCPDHEAARFILDNIEAATMVPLTEDLVMVGDLHRPMFAVFGIADEVDLVDWAVQRLRGQRAEGASS